MATAGLALTAIEFYLRYLQLRPIHHDDSTMMNACATFFSSRAPMSPLVEQQDSKTRKVLILGVQLKKGGCHDRLRLTAHVPPPHGTHSNFPTSTPSPGLSFADHNEVPQARRDSRNQSSPQKIRPSQRLHCKYSIAGQVLAL